MLPEALIESLIDDGYVVEFSRWFDTYSLKVKRKEPTPDWENYEIEILDYGWTFKGAVYQPEFVVEFVWKRDLRQTRSRMILEPLEVIS